MRATTAAVACLAMFALAGCSASPAESVPEPRKQLNLTIGAILPQTGDLAAYGAGTRAAVQLAIDDINQAPTPLTVSAEVRDAGDSTGATALASLEELRTLGIDALVGPLEDGVSKKIIQAVVDARLPVISPGNTASDFTRFADDDLYWRTAVPCTLEGDALAAQVAASGAKTVGVLTQTEACGKALNEAVTVGLERRGVKVTSSASLSDGATIDAAAADFADKKPDAIAIVTSQAKSAIAPLIAAGFTGKQLFFLGLAPGDYSADFGQGVLQGAIATSPGLDWSELQDFTDRMLELDPAATEFRYAPESYDAVVLLALAALRADGLTAAHISGALQEVSGGSGKGQPCESFAECAAIILSGDTADYEGVSGSITFDDRGDPAGAVVGIFKADRSNAFQRTG